ncbi:uncharacterized protein F5147DRAFT_657379 [Suillus discolor]|uniref:Uncharacterized protein n=1 Tax=Suillus discolor TaxID=1912936 RepID=A0A9P7EX33_9AGAM|nr:uncharacterized protein F5147DRAFT_657379 [Suillus discolor]KAG2093477.1 hypothetical protein F5147DRAFT_657379 [Suillus discolor]
MNAFQETPSQADAFLKLGYPYGTVVVYDQFSSIQFAYLHGSCTNSAVACSYLPFVYVSLDMLSANWSFADVRINPSQSKVCQSYEIADVCIFVLRAFAAWERMRWFAIFLFVSVICQFSFTSGKFGQPLGNAGFLVLSDNCI